LNLLALIFLIAAVMAAKKRRISLHKWLINICMLISFLLLYIFIQQRLSLSSPFKHIKIAEESGPFLVLLFSHIGTAIITFIFSLFAYFYGFTSRLEKHKKLVKILVPIWIYSSSTGVLLYLWILLK
ncbi:MAG: DUF420 domain-containing protein, partial [Bdellovibrio sp.]